MKVLLVTGYPVVTNPYTELLVDALRARGIDLEVSEGRGRLQLLRATLRHGRPHIVHLQWHHPFFTARTLPRAVARTLFFWAEWMLLRLLGSKLVWTVHNVVNHDRWQERWELRADRVAARAAAALIVHCDAAVATVAAAYGITPGRIRVVPHGHYVGRYPEAPDRDDARRALGLPCEAKVLLYFGQIRKYKGLDQLLDAFATLEGATVRLVLLGRPHSAELGQAIAARAAEDPRVSTRFGFAPDDELTRHLAACDVVVLPYKDSLTSGAAILAASYGRAILAPALGCVGEFPADAAILYDPREPDGLRRALKQVILVPLDGMGEAARRYIERFPWSLVAQQTEAVYRGVLPSKQGYAALAP